MKRLGRRILRDLYWQARRQQVARVARMHGDTRGAAAAMGITVKSFLELCKRYGIETPAKRRRREAEEARG